MSVMSTTSFLPLWGQSIMSTPEEMSSNRGVRLDCLPDSKYALKSFTVPNFSTRLRTPTATE